MWLAGFCYVAVLGGYITPSTFVTAYFADIGAVTRLDVAVLLVASLGRIGGGVLVEERGVDGARTIGASPTVAVGGFLAPICAIAALAGVYLGQFLARETAAA